MEEYMLRLDEIVSNVNSRVNIVSCRRGQSIVSGTSSVMAHSKCYKFPISWVGHTKKRKQWLNFVFLTSQDQHKKTHETHRRKKWDGYPQMVLFWYKILVNILSFRILKQCLYAFGVELCQRLASFKVPITVIKIRIICQTRSMWKFSRSRKQNSCVFHSRQTLKFTRYCLTQWISKLLVSYEIHRVTLLSKCSFIWNKGYVNMWNVRKNQKWNV